MSEPRMLSFKELIEKAFGNHDETNVVDFKAIETILYLLAHKSGLLHRVVQSNLLDSEGLCRRRSTYSLMKIKVQVPSLPSSSMEHINEDRKSIDDEEIIVIKKAKA